MSRVEPLFSVLNPRGTCPDIQCAPLAKRSLDYSGKVIWLLRSWAAQSGFEPLLGFLEAHLLARFPGVKVIQLAKPSAYSLDDSQLWEKMLNEADAFVYAAGPSCSTTHYAVHYAASLERRGLPGLVLSYETLVKDAQRSVEGSGVAVRFLTCPYPLRENALEELETLAVKAVDLLCLPVASGEQRTDLIKSPAVPRIAITDNLSNVQEYFIANGWTDGLPIALPTEAAVEKMLEGTSLSPDNIVVEAMEPGMLRVSVESVAINAVMAGCTPEAFPIVLAAVSAYAKGHPYASDDFSTPARSTNSFAFMQIVNGPIRKTAEMNGGLNALGPGNRANASIGRALRLAIINLGGGEVGINLMPVQGNPSAYTMAFAENEEASPWPSLAVSQGFEPEENVLTLMTGGWSHIGNYMQGSLEDLADAAKAFEFPSGLAILATPARAKLLHDAGMDKLAVQDRIWSLAVRPASEFRKGVYWEGLIQPTLRVPEEMRRWGWSSNLLSAEDDDLVSVFPRSGVKIVVVGGGVSPMMQGWMMQSAQSVSIDEWS